VGRVKRVENFPVHPSIEVLEGETVYKSKRSWIAVLRYRLRGRITVALYKWHNRRGEWKRAAKFIIPTLHFWKLVDGVVRSMLESGRNEEDT